jgi:hypothetical protein
MNDDHDLGQMVASSFAVAAPSRAPAGLLDPIVMSVGRTRQRPRWLAILKEPPMRHASRIVVGSPTARVAAIAAATLLLGLLATGAFVAGAQSPSPAPPELEAAEPPSFFTGTAPTSGACPIANPTFETVDGVMKKRGESWGCLTWTTEDPRFSGVSKNIWNSDEYITPADAANGRLGHIIAGRERIENDAGAWEGTWTELGVGSEFDQSAGWFVGEGAYDGLVAYVVITDPAGNGNVWGVIKPDDGFEAPGAFVDE